MMLPFGRTPLYDVELIKLPVCSQIGLFEEHESGSVTHVTPLFRLLTRRP